MLVLPIYQGMLSKNYRAENKKSFNSTPNSKFRQDNNLIDYNYGRSLINNKVSFKGDVASLATDLSKKASMAFKYLATDSDLLLIGKDFKTAMKQLSDSIGSFKNIITDIEFIQDEKMVNTLALSKSAEGFDNLTNLGDLPLFFEREGADKIHFLKKGESSFIMDNDYISVKNPTYGFKLKTNGIEEEIDETTSESIQHFSLSDAKKNGIKNINLKNIEDLIRHEKMGSKNAITLDDVGGQDAAIDMLRKKVLMPIKYPKFFNKNLGGMNGTLLVGPPGNGKSRSALALSNEAGVKYFDIDGQLFRTHWYGESGQNIHGFYQKLRDNAPCVAFLDEADAIYKTRGIEGNALGDDDVNLHLREITKLQEDNVPVYLIAATNRPDLIDPGILRRFRNQIEFTNLDTPERCKAVFDIHSRELNVKDFDKENFMEKLSNAKCSGDDIANVVLDAKMASLERVNVLNEMKNGSFVDDENFIINITGKDFDKALENLLAQRKISNSKAVVIEGFRQR